MRMVPAKGFFISVRREAYGDRHFGSRAELREDLACMTFGEKEFLHVEPVAVASSPLGIDHVGGDGNPFPELIGNIVAYFPTALARWLKERRLKRSKPVPEWLAGPRSDCQLGKTTVNWKQRTLRFLHLVLAIENTAFSLCASYKTLTEHKRSTHFIRDPYSAGFSFMDVSR
jgi:hypothetical protein